MQPPTCTGFSCKDKRTRVCFKKPKPKEKYKWKERKWDMKISTCCCSLKRFQFWFFHLEMWLKQSCCLWVLSGQCFTKNFWTLAKERCPDFSSEHRTQVAEHPLRCLGYTCVRAITDMRDQVSYGTRGQDKILAGKENARGLRKRQVGDR